MPSHNYPISADDKLNIYYNCTSYSPGYQEGDLRKRIIALVTIGLWPKTTYTKRLVN